MLNPTVNLATLGCPRVNIHTLDKAATRRVWLGVVVVSRMLVAAENVVDCVGDVRAVAGRVA
jgi:hypothetical protein